MENEKEISKKAYTVFMFVCFVGLAIVARIFYLQAVPDARAQQIAENFVNRITVIEPTRGQIFSNDGRLLATSIPEYSIYWDSQAPYDIVEYRKKIDSLSVCLSRLTGERSATGYQNLFASARREKSRYTLIAEHLGYEELKKFKKFPFVRNGIFKSGFVIEEKSKRIKPLGALAARTIGLEREDHKVGLELQYDSLLSGKKGKQYQQRIAGGVWRPMSDDYIEEPEDGCDLVTTIDVHLQDVAHAALKRQLIKNEAAWGCVVLMEVETGYVRAIANLSRDEEDGTYIESLNLAISQSVEPGSTFKLASLMACLDEGLIDLDDSVATGNGVTKFYGHEMRDSNWDHGGNGTITAEEVFEKSSNIGTALLVKKSFENNKQGFLDKLHEFGLAEPLDIELKGEGQPFMYKKVKQDGWSGLSLTQMAIGYETQMTPLQTLAFYNAVANDGKMMRPLFVQELKRNNKTIKKIDEQVIRKNFCSKKTLDKCRQMMEGVMDTGGTAEDAFRNSPYRVAGKTGTAWLNEKGGYQAGRFRASFVGYFPAEEPKYSCIVVIHDPRHGGYYGSTIAAPVFKELADKIYSTQLEFHEPANLMDSLSVAQKRIPVSKAGNREDLLTVFNGLKIEKRGNADGEWISTTSSKDTVTVSNRSVKTGLVPNVVGMGLQDALYILENNGLKVQVQGYGTVKRQSVQPGASVRSYPNITIELF
jgi:cell division protein FtsI (penicillin-binding protein 3)